MMRRLLLALTLLCAALPAWAAPPAYVGKIGEAVDPFAAPDVSSLTASVTVSAGSDRALTFSVSLRSGSLTVTGCTFNGTEAASLLDTELNGAIRQEVWGLLAPSVTTANAVCTFSGNVAAARMTVHQYTGVSGFGAANSLLGTSNGPNVSLTTTAADSVVFAGVFHAAQTGSPFSPASGTTERTDGVTGPNTATPGDRSFTDLEKTATTAGIYSVSTVAGASGAWSAVAAELLAVASGGASGPSLLTLLGTGGPGGGGSPPPPPPGCNIEMASGSTDAQIAAAIAGAPDGSQICLQAGESVLWSQEVDIDLTSRSLTLDCRGSTLVRNFPGVLLDMFGSEIGTSAFTVSGNTVTWTTLPSGASAGDWVKLTADDDLPGGSHTSATLRNRLGQQVQLTSVSGNTSGFAGTLQHSASYLTNRRGNLIRSKTGIIRDCRILGNSAQTTWEQPSITVRSAIAPTVERVVFVNGLNGGIDFINTVQGLAQQIDCRNLGANTLGTNICVNASASWNTQARGVYANATRNLAYGRAVDIAANAVSLSNYGAAWNMEVSDSVCEGTTGSNACFGLHSEGRFGTFQRVYGFNANACVDARGRDNSVLDSFCVGLTTGVRLIDDVGGSSVANDDGQRWLFDRFAVRQVTGNALTAQNTPSENRVCSSRLESYATAISFTPSQNLASCAWISGVATTFNNNVASNVASDQDNFMCQTCGDILPAGLGADTIDALSGDDLIWGGPGNDAITPGPGIDRLAYLAETEGNDTVTGFVAGGGGDIIDISWFLARAAGAQYTGDPFADGYARAQQSGGDTLIQLDPDGGGNGYVTVATLTGVTAANLVAANWRTTLVAS